MAAHRSSEAAQSGRGDEGRSRVATGRWWLWCALAVAVCAAGGYVAGRWYTQRRGAAGGASGVSVVGPREDRFDGRAFSPQATVADCQQEALRTAEELLATFPRKPQALNVVARFYLGIGDERKSVALWEEAIRIDPNYPDAYFGLGLVAEDEGDFQRAAEMFAKVMELAPSERRAPARYGNALLQQGKLDEAIAFLEDYVRSQPPSNEAVANLGQAYLQRGQLEEARRTFEALVRGAPTDARGYYGLSRVYARCGQRQKAMQYMKRFRELATDDQKVLMQHARSIAYKDLPEMRGILCQTLHESAQVYRQEGQLQKAEQLWRKAAFLEPENVQYRMELLALYEQTGRNEHALAVCQELCQIEPDKALHWLNLGLLHGRLDQREEALEALSRAYQLDPQDPRIRQAYQLARQVP